MRTWGIAILALLIVVASCGGGDATSRYGRVSCSPLHVNRGGKSSDDTPVGSEWFDSCFVLRGFADSSIASAPSRSPSPLDDSREPDPDLGHVRARTWDQTCRVQDARRSP